MSNRKAAKTGEDQLSHGVAVIQSLLQSGKLQEALREVANKKNRTQGSASGSEPSSMTDAMQAPSWSWWSVWGLVALNTSIWTLFRSSPTGFGIDPVLAAIHDLFRRTFPLGKLRWCRPLTGAGYAPGPLNDGDLPVGIPSIGQWGQELVWITQGGERIQGPPWGRYEDLVEMAKTQTPIRNYLQLVFDLQWFLNSNQRFGQLSSCCGICGCQSQPTTLGRVMSVVSSETFMIFDTDVGDIHFLPAGALSVLWIVLWCFSSMNLGSKISVSFSLLKFCFL